MFWQSVHDKLKGEFETIYLQAFIIDAIMVRTEDWLYEHNFKNDYDPRMKDGYRCRFNIGSDTYNWSINMWNKTVLHNPGVEISIDEIGMFDPNKPHSRPILRYLFGFPNLKESSAATLYVDDPVFKEYKEIIDKVFEEEKCIDELFKVRTNPGQPTQSTYVVDDFIHKFNMELSWMKSEKYVSERISFDDFIKMDIDDLNYNNTIYRLADRDPVKIAELFDHMKTVWMLGKQHRISNVYLNGLFYVENCDLQDVSECGYDTIDILCSNANDTKPYKVIEIYLKEGDTNESNPKN
ncbi:MAG: hypothetical protein IKU29_00835, partial [Parabacteroides sp.]|nr:hypothetical protein [Parabacteroides sp.]